MSQFDIFKNPVSRRVDPATSHNAEEAFTVLGQRAERCRQVLSLIVAFPGSTTGELARHMHARHPELPIASAVESPHKRVTDLEEKLLIRRGDKRVCSDTGRERMTWYPTRLGLQEQARLLSGPIPGASCPP